MRLIHIVPLAFFALLVAALYVGLGLNPSVVPTVMINKPVPEFDLPPLKGEARGLSSADLAQGRVSIVNIFASWCVPCRAEHAQLDALAKSGVADLYGINYKDAAPDARQYLNALGDPYKGIGADIKGRVAIDWGAYGVPETYVVNGRGRIVYRLIGPIMPDDIKDKLMPAIMEARK
jgi:cytochrome c biogenesis protein CcmG/thiol:disulfide interchange protein DsbE